jgi:ribonuclease PH
MRIDGRKSNDLRKVTITPNTNLYAEGSALIEFGHTKVMCTVSVESSVPKWLQGSGKGWVTAEYGMLPRSTSTRMKREKILESGRTMEISRLIGRSLRSVVDMTALGENQINVDCDVLQADGGTRTAAITGGFVALALGLNRLKNTGVIPRLGLTDYVAAISVGIAEGATLLDLNYEEDSNCGTDSNFVLNGKGEFIEIQGTAERGSFNEQQLQEMIKSARIGCEKLFEEQNKLLKEFFPFKR